VKDSKEYSGHSARRKVLITKIMPNVVHHMIAWASSEEIDANGLGRTVRKLHQRVAENCAAAVPDSLIIVDGVYQVAVAGVESYVFPKADSIVPAVSAASIIAKTARDEMMQVLAGKYPGYGFERHVGYGTEEHYTAIEQLGVCAIHRKTFGPIRRFIQHGVLTYSR
jgi:ribonuclease HII